MPCYVSEAEKRHVDASIREREEKEADPTGKWEAALCAVLNELDRRGMAYDVMAEASRRGLVRIFPLWTSHARKDVYRLAEEIHKYSVDEQDVIKDILNKQYGA